MFARPARRRAAGDTGTFTLRARHGLEVLADADTVVVPGASDLDVPVDPAVLDALRAVADVTGHSGVSGVAGRPDGCRESGPHGGARVASICSGAFVLAVAGLLRVGPEYARNLPRRR